MQATPELSDDLLQWPYLSLLVSSVAVGVVYLLYLFELAPTLIGVVPRSQLIFLLGQLSVTLFGAYLVVVFVDRAAAATPGTQQSTARSDTSGGAVRHAADAEQQQATDQQPATLGEADGHEADSVQGEPAAEQGPRRHRSRKPTVLGGDDGCHQQDRTGEQADRSGSHAERRREVERQGGV